MGEASDNLMVGCSDLCRRSRHGVHMDGSLDFEVQGQDQKGGCAMKAMALTCALTLPAVVACGSTTSSGTSGPQQEMANPCATRGATYLESFVQVSGTCGAIPSEIINISSNGTITTTSAVTCASVSQTGCTAQDSDCTSTANGYSITATTDVTFASDGSSATGLETVSMTGNGTSCTSTYDVTATRQ